MAKQTHYPHPNPPVYKIEQYILMALGIIMLIAAGLLVIVAFLIPAPLFVIMAGLIVVLSAFVWMRLVITSPVSISREGISVHPAFGKERFIAWSEVQEVKHYPLLPQENHEVVRRMMVGKRKYHSAAGVMLIVDNLPALYRIAGWLVGEHGKSIIALTNRTHEDYAELVNRVEQYTDKNATYSGS